MRGSSSSAFSVSLPAELTIPLYFPLVWIPPNLQACQSLSVQDSLQCLGSLYIIMILNLHNIISEDSEMNNKMATSFKTIKRRSFCFLYRHGRKVKKRHYSLQIFNT